MDGGAWWAIVHGVAKSRTRLSDFTFTFTALYFHIDKLCSSVKLGERSLIKWHREKRSWRLYSRILGAKVRVLIGSQKRVEN